MKEVDVPGRRPPAADRQAVAMDNDYVLTSTKIVKGTAPSAAAPSRPDASPTGTSGSAESGSLYKVKGLKTGELSDHAGHRVAIEGTFEHTDRAKNPVSPATDLVILQATAIRPIAGDCLKK